MKPSYSTIISLIKSALTGEKVEIPSNVDWNTCLALCVAHQIIPMIYYGVENNIQSIPTEFKNALFKKTFQYIIQEENQLNEFNKLSSLFTQNQIDYLPLKGAITKKLYPRPEMRIMCDLDILIRVEQYAKIREIMLQLGYIECEETDHELHWQKGMVGIELHKRIVPNNPTSKDYAKYFGIGWEKAKESTYTKHFYQYSNEDAFIFSFAHFAKHYRERGIGVRHLVEVWVLLNAYKDMDIEYLKRELQKLELYEFYLNIVKTTKNWFENGQADEITEHITNKVFKDGSYGIAEQGHAAVAAQLVKTEGKTQNTTFVKVFKMIFMPLSDMKTLFPVLVKAPILLPVMWIVRWFKIILTTPKNIVTRISNLKKQTNKKADEFNRELEYVGLKFK